MKGNTITPKDPTAFCESTQGHVTPSAINSSKNSGYENVIEQRATSSDEILTLKQVAQYLHLSESKVRRMVNHKMIPYAKLGGQYRFYLPKVRQWIEELTQDASAMPEQNAVDIAAQIWQSTVGE